MKKLLFAGWLSLALALAPKAAAQDPLYQNDGIVTNLITVDALDFLNNGLFAMPVNGGLTNIFGPLLDYILFSTTVIPYDFSDVQNFTNNGIMASDAGFIFDTVPSSFGVRHMASRFVNANPGAISAGSLTNIFSQNLVVILGISPKLKISATNVVNTGVLDAGLGSLMTITGKNVDLSHGTLHMEGFDDATLIFGGTAANGLIIGTTDIGVFTSYWGVGRQTNVLSLFNFTQPNPSTPISNVTNAATTLALQLLTLPNATAAANVNVVATNDFTYQVVFLADTLGQVSTDIRFEPFNAFGIPIVRWSSVYTNIFTGQPATNNLFLEDAFGATTNFQLVTNIGLTLSPAPAPIPVNYSYTRNFLGFELLPAGNTPYDLSVFANALDTNGAFLSTNAYTALGSSVQPVTFQVDPTFPTQTITNIGGRIEISADVLDLTGTIMGGPNYLKLTASNHFAGSTNAQMVFPYADINLRSSNGFLNITNVLAPNVPRFNGPIDVYSARFTNLTRGSFVNTNGVTNGFNITNRYHVLMVLSSLSPTAPALVKDLVLRNTNGSSDLIISDIVNVTNSMFIDTRTLTITTNAPGAPTPTGQLNLLSTGLIWSSSLSTNLKYLTNLGTITAPNTVYFQKRLNPNFPSGGDGPYSNFVNRSTISAGGGDIIWADNVENSGSPFAPASITASFGPITVQSTTASLSNGTFTALNGAIGLTSGSLTISNHALQASAALSVAGTNLLTDAGSSNNVWLAGDGFSMPVTPASGDLRGTTISNTCLPNLTSQNTWAGAVKTNLATNGFTNPLPAMSNNAPLGHLVLRGGNNASVFHFKGPVLVNPYALYVDELELKDGATNRQNLVFTALNIDTNVTIYFLDAVIGNNDISEKLNGANGGRLVWLSNYVGRFSATNITYPDAQTFQFNRGLAQSLTLDSDNDGIVNGVDPTPFPEPFSASSIALSISVTHQPSLTAQITWQAPALSTNYLYYRTLANPNWLTLTNFVKSASGGPVLVTDPVLSGRLYKVRIDPLQ